MLCALNIPWMACPLRLKVHSGPDIVSEHILKHNIWEPYETMLVLQHLQPGSVFLDIGANIGYYTVLAGRAVGVHGLVIAYEPDGENFRLLEHNIALNGLTNVRPFKAALGENSSQGSIYLSQNNRGNHRLFDEGDGRKTAAVEILNGDEHVAQLSERLDFIKIDTEGYEAHVLEGLRATILANRDHLGMVIEFCPYGLRRAHTSGTQLLETLAEFDLPLFIIDHLAHQLIPARVDELQQWVDEVDADGQNQGFMNLLVSSRPDF
ncbi:MAG: FkbM family methyltransferase [Syntrophaceae bacterium]